MSASDVAIVAALVFAWGTLSARLERFDVTAPITFVLAGLLLTHGPLAPLGYAPSHELIKDLAEITLVLVCWSALTCASWPRMACSSDNGGASERTRICVYSRMLSVH